MAATGIVPPYDFISDGMGLKNAGRELWSACLGALIHISIFRPHTAAQLREQ
jgi:hypothetical protein